MSGKPGRTLVSIVTPSFNQGRFLARTIDSVLAQDYENLEYIVIDGGSTDASLDILRTFGDRVRWHSGPDAGQAAAINAGFRLARGDVRGYLNSDDVLCPGAVRRVVESFAETPDCDLIYGRALYIDEEDHVIGSYCTWDYSFEQLVAENPICQPAAFWTKRIAERVGPFDERLHYALDYDYWFRIAKAGGKMRHVADTLAASRLHPETKTLSSRPAIFKEIFAVSEAHAGRVGRTYFIGLWHDRLAAAAPWLRRLRFWRRLCQVFGWTHHRWYHSRVLRRPRSRGGLAC